MRRCGVIVGALMIAVCGAVQVQAQIETVVVTARFVGPRAQNFLTTTWKRLTPDGQAFVKFEAKRVYDRTIDVATAQTETEENCVMAFGSCGNEDVTALTALVLEQALSDSIPDTGRLLSNVSLDKTGNTLEQVEACTRRNDFKCAKKVLLKSLPADKRQELERVDERLREIRRDLKKMVAQAGFDQKDDK